MLTPALLAAGVVAGFLRDLMLAHQFGLSRELDIFRAASIFPTVFSQTIGVAFVFALVPFLSKSQDASRRIDPQRMRDALFVTLLLTLGIFAAGLVSIALQASYLGIGFATHEIDALAGNMAITWLIMPVVGLSFGLRAIFYCLDKPFAGSATPAVQSTVFVALLWLAGTTGLFGPVGSQAVSVIYLASGVAILLLHLIAFDNSSFQQVKSALARKSGYDLPQMRVLVWALFTSIAYYTIMSVPRIVDQHFMGQLAEGSIAATEFSYSLTLALTILVATSFNILFIARFNRAVASGAGPKRHVLAFLAISALSLVGGLIVSTMSDFLVGLVFGLSGMPDNETRMISEVFSWQIAAFGFLVFNTIAAQLLLSLDVLLLLLVVAVVKLGVKYLTISDLFLEHGLASAGMSLLVSEAFMAVAFALILFLRLRKGGRAKTAGTPPVSE